MPYSQIATVRPEYMLFIGDGSLKDAEEFFEWCMTSIKKAQEHGLNRLLYDNRTLLVEMAQHDVMVVSDRLADMDVQLLGFRFAVVSSRETLELSRFVETTFTNRSATYKTFGSQEEALKWLLA